MTRGKITKILNRKIEAAIVTIENLNIPDDILFRASRRINDRLNKK